MSHGFGIERPPAHVQVPVRPAARYLVSIESAGTMLALMFTEAREMVANFDAGAEEVALMTRGLQPAIGATGPEWDRPLGGHSAEERAAAEVFVLDV